MHGQHLKLFHGDQAYTIDPPQVHLGQPMGLASLACNVESCSVERLSPNLPGR